MKNRLVLAGTLVGLCLAAVIVVLVVKARDAARPSVEDGLAASPSAAPDEVMSLPSSAPDEATALPSPVEAVAASPAESKEAPAADDADVEDDILSELPQMSDRERYEKLYEALEAARKDLSDRLYETEELARGGHRVRMRVGLEEAAEILEEFINRFSPLDSVGIGYPGTLTRERTMLAEFYYRLKRTEDARKTFETAIAKRSEGEGRDRTTISWAVAEGRMGDAAFAEELLLDLISSPIPPQSDKWMHDDRETVRRLEAPLTLARIYRKSGQINDAQMQLDKVCRFALSLKKEHQAYGNIPYFYSRACSTRIGIIFDLADPSNVDAALQEAEKVVSEYETNLSDYRRQGSDHRKKYVDNRVKSLRKQARARAEKMKKETGASKTADESP
ncbi:MAG: tetratricopeptide repeat protein [Planctomycetes bacterium]|nr:tetratricopeptide repeat protein [Planctomycetota bacterium]